MRKTIQRPWGTRQKGGSWVIRLDSLMEALKKGEAVTVDKVTVGTKPLLQLLRCLPGEYCRVSANGKLEIETVRMFFRTVGGKRKVYFGKPKRYHNWFGLHDGAWLKPYMRVNPVILKPRKL